MFSYTWKSNDRDRYIHIVFSLIESYDSYLYSDHRNSGSVLCLFLNDKILCNEPGQVRNNLYIALPTDERARRERERERKNIKTFSFFSSQKNSNFRFVPVHVRERTIVCSTVYSINFYFLFFFVLSI